SCCHCFRSSRLNISISVLPTIHTPRSANLFNTPYSPPISSQPTIQLDSSLKDYRMVLFPKVQLLVRFSNHIGGRPALIGFATHGYWSPIHILQGPPLHAHLIRMRIAPILESQIHESTALIL